MDILNRLFKDLYGVEPEFVALPAAGSSRKYYRLSSDSTPTVIGCIGSDADENRAFIYLACHLRAQGINTPRVLAQSDDALCYLTEDFGDVSLFDAIESGRASGLFQDKERKLLGDAVRGLAHIQIDGAVGLDFEKCYPSAKFDSQLVQWDLNYFKYCFLKVVDTAFDELALQADFDALTAELCTKGPAEGFLYRDYQSRNIMVTADGTLGFIDFQGGRRGPVEYDVASLLWQARANIPEALRRDLVEEYLDEMKHILPDFDIDAFRRRLPLFVLLRTLQVLGAYGLRGLAQRKSIFATQIPAAMVTLRTLLEQGVIRQWPALEQVCHSVADDIRWQPRENDKSLTVTVISFSYRKGVPDDPSGNGGGFVFDCRGVHNPGRYDQYKALTGMDMPVRKFLESDGEITRMLANVRKILEPSVNRYKLRGFTDLQVCFGCTGGRHRSVYGAEETARWLSEQFNIKVRLIHREQDIDRMITG